MLPLYLPRRLLSHHVDKKELRFTFIIIVIISFMQGIYTYIPETNNVPREYIVVAILLLLFMVPTSLVPALALLCFYVTTFRSMCLLLLLLSSLSSSPPPLSPSPQIFHWIQMVESGFSIRSFEHSNEISDSRKGGEFPD
jgi:hypothetical protein